MKKMLLILMQMYLLKTDNGKEETEVKVIDDMKK